MDRYRFYIPVYKTAKLSILLRVMVQEVLELIASMNIKSLGGRMAKTSIKRVAVEIPEDLGIHLSELEEGLQVKSALRLYEKSMVSSSQARRVAGLTWMGSLPAGFRRG